MEFKQKTKIAMLVEFACWQIGMEWRVTNGLQYAS